MFRGVLFGHVVMLTYARRFKQQRTWGFAIACDADLPVGDCGNTEHAAGESYAERMNDCKRCELQPPFIRVILIG